MPKKGGKKKGKSSKKKEKEPKKVLSDGYLIPEKKPVYVPLPGENLLEVLTTHKVTEKELFDMKISTKALKELVPEEIKDLKFLFDTFDSNRDGYLDAYELRMSMRAVGFKLSTKLVEELMTVSGTENGSLLDFNGFLHCVIESQTEERDTFNEILQGFRYLDIDDCGYVSPENIKDVVSKFNLSLKNNDIADMVELADLNGDGKVSEGEFIKIMRQTNLFKDEV